MTDQQVVEQSWLQIGVSDGTKQYPAGTVHIQIQGDHWETFADWAYAAEFTRENDRLVAEIDDEIEWLNDGIDVADDEPEAQRMLTRLTAARDEMRRGRKP